MADVFRPPRCKYRIGNGYIETDGSVTEKITGTSLGAILGKSVYSTPFLASCRLLGLGEADISKKRAVILGKELEPVLIKYADETFGDSIGRFIPAEDVPRFAERAGEHETWVSDFDDPVFAGHLDGIVVDPDGEEYILEVKTASHPEDWGDTIPEHYYWQVALYNRFVTGKDKAYVLVGFTDDASYRDTDAFVPCANTVRLYTVQIDQDAVEQALGFAVEWYNEFVMNHRTPECSMDNPRDKAMYDHLVNAAEDIEDVKALLREADRIRNEISTHESEIEDLYASKKAHDEKIKDYLKSHDLTSLTASADGWDVVAEIKVSEKKVIDEDLMVLDGIDVERYKVSKATPKMFIKRINKKDKEE